MRTFAWTVVDLATGETDTGFMRGTNHDDIYCFMLKKGYHRTYLTDEYQRFIDDKETIEVTIQR